MLKTRLDTLEAVGPRPPGGAGNDMDTSSCMLGKRPRDLEELPAPETPAMGTQGKRRRGEAVAAALAVDKSAPRAQWWNPATKPQVEAPQSPVVEDAGGAISPRVADECNRALGQDSSLDEEQFHADLVREGKLRELAAWKKYDVPTQRDQCQVSKQVVQARWVLTWKMVDGRRCVEARPVAKGFQDPDSR